MINIVAGDNNLPKVVLTHASGASAEVYLHGAHVTSWVTAAGEELFFISRLSEFAPHRPIRGGIPLCWPQFSGQGPLPAHGLVRLEDWELASSETRADDSLVATLRLSETAATLALWPHPFTVELTVTLQATALTVQFRATNTSSDTFTSQLAFHSYFRVADINQTAVRGLHEVMYLDAMNEMKPTLENGAEIRFAEEIDRVYLKTPDTLQIIDEAKNRTITIEKSEDMPDAVIWNPWIAKAQRLPDYGDEEYQQMVCAETGRIIDPVTLAPGESWTGSTTFRVCP